MVTMNTVLLIICVSLTTFYGQLHGCIIKKCRSKNDCRFVCCNGYVLVQKSKNCVRIQRVTTTPRQTVSPTRPRLTQAPAPATGQPTFAPAITRPKLTPCPTLPRLTKATARTRQTLVPIRNITTTTTMTVDDGQTTAAMPSSTGDGVIGGVLDPVPTRNILNVAVPIAIIMTFVIAVTIVLVVAFKRKKGKHSIKHKPLGSSPSTGKSIRNDLNSSSAIYSDPTNAFPKPVYTIEHQNTNVVQQLERNALSGDAAEEYESVHPYSNIEHEYEIPNNSESYEYLRNNGTSDHQYSELFVAR